MNGYYSIQIFRVTWSKGSFTCLIPLVLTLQKYDLPEHFGDATMPWIWGWIINDESLIIAANVTKKDVMKQSEDKF